MSHRRFKMYTPERISIIMLVTALLAWAAVTLCRRIPDDVAIEIPSVPASDTVIYNGIDSTIFVGKKENLKKRTKKLDKKRKQKKEVKHRDHLNEPVPNI